MSQKERPILFSGPMIRAILDGRKTQTRRIMKPQPQFLTGRGHRVYANADFKKSWEDISGTGEGTGYDDCRYGKPGDNLYVRESFFLDGANIAYRADHERYAPKDTPWKPSIHMPRILSRILLEITDVRAERLHDISEADAKAEGVEENQWLDIHTENMRTAYLNYLPEGYRSFMSAKDSFASLWQSIHGPESWNQNPWVWAITFKRI